MAKKKETVFKEKVAGALETLPNTFYEKIQQVAKRGTPDFLCCIAGRFVAIELKTDTGIPDALQEYKLKRIAGAGGVGIIMTPMNFSATFDALLELAHEGEIPDHH